MCNGVRIGHNVSSYHQVDEAFCDDENIVGTDLDDVIKFVDAMEKFEEQSGALLSRNKKSKIMYIGNWAGRQDSPYPWLQVVHEIKVFGLVLTPNYTSTLRRTWEEVLRGFQKTIYSWKERGLESMFQRAEAARTFAQSKLWYVSQVLPLPASFAKKMESLLSSFLFRGKPERLKLCELYNPPSGGGLGLIDIRSKADALFLKQLTRMLHWEGGGSYKHLSYWLGAHLLQHLPSMMERSPVLHTAPPPYHQYALDLLNEAFKYGMDPDKLEGVTAKRTYLEFTDTLPEPKVTDKFTSVNFPGDVWPRLSYTSLTTEPRQIVFDSIHGLIRNRARLYEQERVGDPHCLQCPDQVADVEHIFCHCQLVRNSWLYVRNLVCQHQPELRGVEDKVLTRFLFPRDNCDQEVVWLLANFMQVVQEQCVARNSAVTVAGTRGILKERLRMMQTRAVQLPLVTIP